MKVFTVKFYRTLHEEAEAIIEAESLEAAESKAEDMQDDDTLDWRSSFHDLNSDLGDTGYEVEEIVDPDTLTPSGKRAAPYFIDEYFKEAKE